MTETANVIRSIDRRTGAVVGECPDMDVDSVNAVVSRARAAATEWAATDLATRCEHLREIRRHWVRRSPELSRVDAAETGKSMIDATYEVLAVATHLDWCSWNARRALKSRRVSTVPVILKKARVEYSPLGVVGVIAPWNYPAGIPMQVIPWALAAGNTVVLKPSELTSQTGLVIADIINGAGRELVHVATGGATAGAAVSSSPDIDKIEFTGSGSTATHVLRSAAEHVTPVVMELGGKDAMIVTSGADLDTAARTAASAAFFNAGQTCMATERVIAVDAVHDELVGRIVAATGSLVVGSTPGSHVGPLTMAGSLERALDRIDRAVAGGAKVVTGGGRVDGEKGEYLQPTVLVDVPPDAEVVTDENFAPVLCVIRVRDVDEAVEVANSVELGLSASVFASCADEARSIASRLEVGGVVVGDAMVGAALPGVAFGGEKRSGHGRLQGVEGFREFSRSRAVVEPRVAVPLMATMAIPRPDPEVVHALADAILGGGGPVRRLRAVGRAIRATRSPGS